MPDKKPESPAKKENRKKFLQKLFTVSMLLVLGLAGFSAGHWIQQNYLYGERIKGGIGNTTETRITVYPNDAALEFPIGAINSARHEILVMARSIQSKAIIDSLAKRSNEGVKVAIILNHEDVVQAQGNPNSPIDYMRRVGLLDIRTDPFPSTQQTLILDGEWILISNGGFSSRAAGGTSATLALIQSKTEARKLREYFIEMYQKGSRIFE